MTIFKDEHSRPISPTEWHRRYGPARKQVNIKWDIRFLGLARHVAQWSKDPSTKVGAVITRDDHRIMSLGYNGFPVGVNDDPNRYDNRDVKYAMVVHAEANALMNTTASVIGCTLYVYPFHPCHECAKLIIQAGIKRVVSLKSDVERWKTSFGHAQTMFEEAGVVINLYDEAQIDSR